MNHREGKKKSVVNYTQFRKKKRPKIVPGLNGGRMVRAVFAKVGIGAIFQDIGGTNAEERCYGGAELGGREDFIMGDLSDVVEDGRLEIREEQVRIVKFHGEEGEKRRTR